MLLSLKQRRDRALPAAAALSLAIACSAAAAANASPSAPFCDHSSPRNSMARAGGRLTVSPEPGTNDATPQTQISIVGVPASQLSQVRVEGTRSGIHPGTLEPYSQGDGASFVPDRGFAEGERVTVKLDLQAGGRTHVVGWRFTVDYKAGLGSSHIHKKPRQHAAQLARQRRRHHHRHGGRHHGTGRVASAFAATASPVIGEGATRAAHPAHIAANGVQSFRSRPGLHPPRIEVTVNHHENQPGYLFMSPFTLGQAGPMIVGDEGQLVWFHPVTIAPLSASKATNLQVQSFDGEPMLTWWQDPLQSNGSGRREPEDVIYNHSYQQVATVRAGNGLVADVHEFRITPQDTALIATKHDIRCNLQGVKGAPEGSVWDGVIQEVDIATGLVRWEWNSLDHVGLQEAYDTAAYATASYPYDFFHLNSIQLLGPRSLLASARNTWTMYDIDRRTGKIRWRLGGKRTSFKMGKGTRTAWQHDARLIGWPAKKEMLLSVFDNGSTPREHRQSRGLVELLDLAHRTATLKRVLANTPPLLAGSQGSVQTLSDGDTIVGWGQEPWITEFNSSGQITFDAHMPAYEQSYRGLRYEWEGTPTAPPDVAVERAGSHQLAVYASWNGSTLLAGWQVLEGRSESALSPVATAPKSGFETEIKTAARKPFVEVQALSSSGEVLGTSKPQKVQ